MPGNKLKPKVGEIWEAFHLGENALIVYLGPCRHTKGYHKRFILDGLLKFGPFIAKRIICRADVSLIRRIEEAE